MLDAWLASAKAEEAAEELNYISSRKINWKKVCRDTWKILGKRTELKELLVERLIHSQRHKIKERIWHDDLASEFGRDLYLGPIKLDKKAPNNPGREWSYVKAFAPGFDEKSSPRVKKLEAQIYKKTKDAEWFLYTIAYGWLCSPKAFRFLERLIWAIGKGKQSIYTGDHRIKKGDKVPSFTLKDQNGKEVSIEEFFGKPFVLYFYPKDDTPGCTAEACSFRDAYSDLKELDSEVVGISADSPESHLAFAKKYDLPFTLLSDENNKVRKQFNVPGSLFGLLPGRVTYVVDENAVVQHIFNSQMQTRKHVKEALKKLASM